MSVKLCTFCKKTYVEWAATKFGGRLPFAYTLVEIDSLDNPEDGWAPGQWQVGKRQVLAMAPITHYGTDRQSRARRVAVVHACQEYLDHRAQKEKGKAEELDPSKRQRVAA